MVETVSMETDKITSSIQSSLTGTRVAGGSISSSSDAGADGGGGGGGSDGGSASDAAASSSSSASADDSGGDSSADEGGDEESSESASSGGSGGAVSGANVLVDTSNIGSTGQQIDTPVTSSGNSSLWSGEDGLGETPGGGQ